MMRTWMIGLGMILSAALPAAPTFAQDDEIDRECVMDCRAEHRDCKFDAREAASQCLEEAGCDVLREDYRAECFAEERDDEACADARAAYRECLDPCRDARHEAAQACREDTLACLQEDCGIEEPIRRRPGRRGGRGGRR